MRNILTFTNQVMSRIDHKFDLMYAKRAFVHWYVTQERLRMKMVKVENTSGMLLRENGPGAIARSELLKWVFSRVSLASRNVSISSEST